MTRGESGPVTVLVTVAPLVVHHPALAVQAGGAPGPAGVAVPGGAGVEGLPGVEEGEDAGLATNCPTGSGCEREWRSLGTSLETLETPGTPAQHIRGSSTRLQLRPGTPRAAAALVQRVLAAGAAGGRGRALRDRKYSTLHLFQLRPNPNLSESLSKYAPPELIYESDAMPGMVVTCGSP